MTVTPTRRILVYALMVVGLLTLVGIASNAEQFSRAEQFNANNATRSSRDILPIEGGLVDSGGDDFSERTPIEIPRPVLIALAAGMLLGVLYLLSRQQFSLRFRRPAIRFRTDHQVEITEEEHAGAIAEFTRDVIDELRAGDSPRYAIQRAYAAVETGFGARELARKSAETPLSYMSRIFGQHGSIEEPLVRLTDLFQQARYSREPVTEAMRTAAIEALYRIRDHYTMVAAP